MSSWGSSEADGRATNAVCRRRAIASVVPATLAGSGLDAHLAALARSR